MSESGAILEKYYEVVGAGVSAIHMSQTEFDLLKKIGIFEVVEEDLRLPRGQRGRPSDGYITPFFGDISAREEKAVCELKYDSNLQKLVISKKKAKP